MVNTGNREFRCREGDVGRAAADRTGRKRDDQACDKGRQNRRNGFLSAASEDKEGEDCRAGNQRRRAERRHRADGEPDQRTGNHRHYDRHRQASASPCR